MNSESQVEGADPLQLAQRLAQQLWELKASEICILDLRGLVSFCDCFILCNAQQKRQVQGIAQRLREEGNRAPELGLRSVEGLRTSWVILDYGDVVVHIFDHKRRAFYDLDTLWADAPRVPTLLTDQEEEEESDGDAS